MAERAGVYASPADDILLEAIMLKLILASSLAVLAVGAADGGAPAPPAGAPPSAPIVFFDVAGPDAGKLKQFYASNFGWAIDAANGVKTPGLEGTLRQDPPETLIYLGVRDIDATLKVIVNSGGSVALPRTVVPNVVTFAIFKDPAGNRVGLVETK
jgi:predicted enzyme related to lactoylglutathione lyase